MGAICSQLIKNEIEESFLSVVWISRLFILFFRFGRLWLFPVSKSRKMAGKNLDIEIIDVVNGYFEEKDKSLLEKA